MSPPPLRAAWELVRDSASEWSADNCSQLGAALAFYTFFSLAPLLVIVIAVAGIAFGREAAQGRVVEQIQGLVGPQAAVLIQGLVARAQDPDRGRAAGVIGGLTLLFGAAGVVQALQGAMNVIWKAPPRSGLGYWASKYALSYAIVLAIGFLSLVSLVLNAALAAAGGLLVSRLPFSQEILEAFNALAAFAGVTVLLALMFKWLPETRVEWRDARAGAVLTSLLMEGGKYVLGRYLGSRMISSTYGAAGSLVVILLWVYYSAQIVYLGAEFAKVRSRRKDGRAPERASIARG